MYNPRTTREVYESLAALANRRDAPTPISDDEYYPARAELMCWLTEFELAERIAAAHPLNPVGSYGRLVARHLEARTKADILTLLSVFGNWTGKDAVVAAVQNATTDEAARKLYAIGVYLPHGRRMYEFAEVS